MWNAYSPFGQMAERHADALEELKDLDCS